MLVRLGDIVSLCFGVRRDGGKEEFFFSVRLRLVVWRRDVVSVCATTLGDECFSEFIVRFRFLVSRGVVSSPRLCCFITSFNWNTRRIIIRRRTFQTTTDSVGRYHFLTLWNFVCSIFKVPTQGRILEDANDTGSCKGFSALYHSGGSPFYQRRMTQF